MSDSARCPVFETPLHSFGLAAKAEAIGGTCGVWANERTGHGFVSLRGQVGNGDFLDGAARVLGGTLPMVPCTFATLEGATVLWLSPDEWMIIAPRERAASLASQLRAELAGIHSQVVDNSSGFTEVLVAGPKRWDVLSHSTVYDLHKLGQGRVVGTTFGKVSVHLRQDGEALQLLVRRSFADYVWRFLARAAQPYGLAIGASGPTSEGHSS